MPGHTASWCLGYPTACIPCGGGLPPALDPSSNETYALARSIIAALRGTFSDPWVHLEGDEVSLTCWASNPRVAAWLVARHPGLDALAAAAAEAYGVFVPAVDAMATELGFGTVVHWEDVFDFAGGTGACGGVTPSLNDSTVVQVCSTLLESVGSVFCVWHVIFACELCSKARCLPFSSGLSCGLGT
jgi:hypothetical protein